MNSLQRFIKEYMKVPVVFYFKTRTFKKYEHDEYFTTLTDVDVLLLTFWRATMPQKGPSVGAIWPMVIESDIVVQLTCLRLRLDLNLHLPHKRGDIPIYTTYMLRSSAKKRKSSKSTWINIKIGIVKREIFYNYTYQRVCWDLKRRQ